MDISTPFPECVNEATQNGKITKTDQNAAEKLTDAVQPKESTKVAVSGNSNKATNSKKKKWEKRMRYQPKSVMLDKGEKNDYYKKLLDEATSKCFDVPRVITATAHAAECFDEMKSMLAAVKQHSGNKTALQVLPRHMRRRAASHNVKRLPRRLRELAKQQADLTQGNHCGRKELTRRKRRRKLHLQNQFAKKIGKQCWLETHMWHAKRFHMVDAKDLHYVDWFHRVAHHPNDKCFRASYRALAKHCVIQDISYYKCVELEGKIGELHTIFNNLNYIGSKQNLENLKLSTEKESYILLYDDTTVPRQCVGPVSVMWKPCVDSSLPKVWMWVHPAIFEQIFKILELYTNNSEVCIRDISDTLVRFRLCGPKSSITLLSVLKVYHLLSHRNDGEYDASNKLGINTWIAEKSDMLEQQQSDFISSLKECHQVAFHQSKTSKNNLLTNHGDIIPVLVNDPRLTLPVQKTSPSFKDTSDSFVEICSTSSSRLTQSPLWQSSIREEVSSSRMADHVVSTRKNESRFASEDEKNIWIDSLSTPVPVMLIRQSGFQTCNHKRSVHGGPPDNFGAGWDLIMPANWAMAFWVPLIYHKARAVGLRENFHSNLECKLLHFPRDYPDSEAGKKWWKAEGESLRKTYYKKPPSKRPNYVVLATPFPFEPNWSYLFRKDDMHSEKLSVHLEIENDNAMTLDKTKLEGNVLLHENFKTITATNSIEHGEISVPICKKGEKRKMEIAVCIDNTSKKQRMDDTLDRIRVLRDTHQLNLLHKVLASPQQDDYASLLEDVQSRHINTLICVTISPINKGIPFPMSTLCLPTSDDIRELRQGFNSAMGKGLASCIGPLEQAQADNSSVKKNNVNNTEETRRRNGDKKTEDEINPFHNNVVPSRNVIGFVTSGDFLFSFAAGGGIGFISMEGLLSLVEMYRENAWLASFVKDHVPSPGILALMRNTDSFQYRFVTINVLNKSL